MPRPPEPTDGGTGKWAWHTWVDDVADGLTDADGNIGSGHTVPQGGVASQVLTKASSSAGDTAWQDPQGPPGPPGMVWQGAWDATVSYAAHDGVSHGGQSWIATGNTSAGEEPGVAVVWDVLASQGDTGPQGPTGPEGPVGPEGPQGLVWQGAWDATVAYAVNDGVSHADESWIANAATAAGDEPGVAPAWDLLAASADVSAHAAQHQAAGSDVINVGGLSGELADPQPPKAHNHDAAYVNVAGDTMTGALTLPGDPAAALEAASKGYVDGAVDNATPRSARNEVGTAESTASTTFTDLATVGPQVTLDVGPAGIAIVTVAADMRGATSGASMMGVEVSGANVVGASTAEALFTVGSTRFRASYTMVFTGLTAGSTTFTAKYRNDAGASATFAIRDISVTTW